MSVPLVSIIMPTYNQEAYVEQSVRSCVEQAYPEVELLIGDDVSSDGTWSVISRLAAEYPDRIRASQNDKNLGVSANCNTLLRKCQGEYVALFAGDDLMYPGKLERQVRVLENAEDIAICYHDIDVVDESSQGPPARWSTANPGRSGGFELFLKHLCFTCGSSLLVRRKCLPENGYLEAIVASDWLLYVETLLNANHRIEYISEVLGGYRRRPGQLTEKSGPDCVTHFFDHAFACGYLYGTRSSISDGATAAFQQWKSAAVNEIRNNSVWGESVSDAQLNSPRWLLRKLFQSLKRRLTGA